MKEDRWLGWPGKDNWDPDRYIVAAVTTDDLVLYYVDDLVGWTAQKTFAVQYAEEVSAEIAAARIFRDAGERIKSVYIEKLGDAEKNRSMYFERFYGIRVNNYWHALKKAKKRLEIRRERQAAAIEKQKQKDKQAAYRKTPKNVWWR